MVLSDRDLMSFWKSKDDRRGKVPQSTLDKPDSLDFKYINPHIKRLLKSIS